VADAKQEGPADWLGLGGHENNSPGSFTGLILIDQLPEKMGLLYWLSPSIRRASLYHKAASQGLRPCYIIALLFQLLIV